MKNFSTVQYTLALMQERTWVEVSVVIVVTLLVLRKMKQVMFCPEVYGRHAYKRGRREIGSDRRRRLDMLRAKKGHFPLPYPDGWYKIANSHEVPVGKVFTEGALGREFVVFRGEDGVAAVVDAFCPHLGTHLGHGGIVKGNNLVCPYHNWAFNKDGKCTEIPYCKKDMTGSSRINLPKYETYESKTLQAIFFWFSADGSGPRWKLHSGLSQVEEEISKGQMRLQHSDRWPDMLMHVFEPSQNSADYFHFQTVHQYLPMPFNLKLVKADHTIRTQYGENDMVICETLDRLRVFGLNVLTIPSFVARSIKTEVHIQGPNNVLFRVDTPIGRFRGHFALLPIEPFQQKATMVMYSDWYVPYFLNRLLYWWITETASQDLEVWENKIHVAPRNLVVGDGPFAQYGKWLKNFYTEKSMTWSEVLSGAKLDW